MFRDGRSAFFIHDTLVEDLPDESTQTVRDRANRLGVSEPDDEAPIHELKDTAFSLHRGVGGLIEEPAHLPIAVRGPVAVIDARALVVTRAGTDPGGQPLRRGECPGRGSDFGDDLLRRIHAQPGHGREPFDGSLMVTQ